MPLPNITRKFNIDMQPNVAVGVALPFNNKAVFTQVYNTKEQLKYNFINLLLTNKGERVFNPDFGTDLKKYIFEHVTESNFEFIKSTIIDNTNKFIPQINIINVNINSPLDSNIINVEINYKIRLTNENDSVNINFE
jgi:phage baseplate assembly protein W